MLSKTYTKYIQGLHNKKYRDAGNCFIAEGNKVVLELLHAQIFECEQVLAKEAWLKKNETLLNTFYKGPLHEITGYELQKISALSTPGEVLAVFKKTTPKEPIIKAQITLVLDAVQDPGNLGTIIRIADWFGVRNIICSKNCVDMYNPKVVQGSMGSLGRVNINYENLPDWLQQHNGVLIYAAALHGQNIKTMEGINEGIIVIGNESKGISMDVLEIAHQKITIPKTGLAESLNAAVATGIILSHIVN